MADPTPDEKLVKLQQENDQLKAQIAAKPKAEPKEAEPEDLTPTPTQAELDSIKLGEHHLDAGKKGSYATRQVKA